MGFVNAGCPAGRGAGVGGTRGGKTEGGLGRPDTSVPFQPSFGPGFVPYQMGFQPNTMAPPFTPGGIMYYPNQYQPGSTMEPAALSSAIQKQVEYYFSTNNLARDTYLRSQMDTNGFIPIAFILGFKRLSMLTRDPTALAEAIGDSAEVRDAARFCRSPFRAFCLPPPPHISNTPYSFSVVAWRSVPWQPPT